MGVESRLKVGIFFNARAEQGGLYHYALTLVDCLQLHAPEFDYFLYHATLEDLPLKLSQPNWELVRFHPNEIRARLAVEAGLMTLARAGIEIPFRLIPCYQRIAQNPPDVILYVKPTLHVFQWNIPAIFPIHDLQHRLQPEFPEVSDRGEFRRREYMYLRSVDKARAILTDSETGKEDVIACYNGKPEKIFPLPYIAPTFRENDLSVSGLGAIQKKYDLPEKYFFYPAAFWKHKNHERLVRAISILAQRNGVRVPLLLAGNKNREFENVMALVRELELEDIVRFLGYVPDDDLYGLYHHALALVMPTFFGPTNIPILEAWAVGCPVITSDLRGIREQVGDAGLLVNPRDVSALADAMWLLYQDFPLRQSLAENGTRRALSWTPEMFARRLVSVIQHSASNKP